MQSLLIRPIQAVELVAAIDVLSAMTDEEIDQFIDDFADAYVEAQRIGNEEVVAIIGKSLKIVGRYLATTVGPKAAGVLLN